MSTLHCVKPYTHWVLWSFSVFCAICSMLRSKCVDPPKDMTISRSWRSSTSQKPWQLDMAYLHSEVDSDAIFNYNCHATSHAENCRQIFVGKMWYGLRYCLGPTPARTLGQTGSPPKFKCQISEMNITAMDSRSLDSIFMYRYLHVFTCPYYNMPTSKLHLTWHTWSLVKNPSRIQSEQTKNSLSIYIILKYIYI